MFKKKPKIKIEIDKNIFKTLKLFESVDGNYNDLGYAISYTKVPGGVIRTIINTESMDQIFIPLPQNYLS